MGPKLKRRLLDYRVTRGGLILANLVIAVGFVYEYGLISLTFAAIGLAGILCWILFILWVATVVVEYIAGE